MENHTFDQDTIQMTTGSREHDNQSLPLLITPKYTGTPLTEWINQNKVRFEKELAIHGGILLRGFGIESSEDFNAFIKCFDSEPLPYMFRSSPRKELDEAVKNIYLSTSYPSDRSINMHNETSYSRIWGRKIIFCCLKPAETGGETPIADSRRVLKYISPELTEKFRTKGVKYRRNLLPNMGMPWQEVFQTDDINVVRETCKKFEINYSFSRNGDMIIEWIKPAIYLHPDSQEETWFNHVSFFNKYSRYEELGLDPGDTLPAEYLTSETFFGDGSEISYPEYTEIIHAYNKNKVVFPYEKGDILVLDNMLTAHGRNPYKGDRVIATAIIEAAYDADQAHSGSL